MATKIQPTTQQAIQQENTQTAKARFAQSGLKGKSPQELYTVMQTRMDNWASLADARDDLREWLPMMAAGLAWMLFEVEEK